MRKIIPLLLTLGIMMLGVASCKEKKKNDDIIIAKYVPKKLTDPIKMAADERRSDVKWKGKNYAVVITRTAVDSLPMVKDETGQLFVDNKIVLTITRQDGSQFLRKVFTKNTFASYLDDDYRKNGLLESMVFDEVDDNELEFGISVSRPDSDDEFIPLKMSINYQGGLSIQRDTDLDTVGIDDDDDDD